MLRSVIPTVLFKESVLTKVQKQQTCVWDSLTRAFNEVKMAKLEGKPLQDIDDFLKELDAE